MIAIEQKVLNYNVFFSLIWALGFTFSLLLGITSYGIIVLIVTLIFTIYFNYKRIFTIEIKNLFKKKTFIIDSIGIILTSIIGFLSTKGSLLNLNNAEQGETFFSIYIFQLLGAFLFLVPCQISSRKIVKDPKMQKYLKNKLGRFYREHK